MLFFQVQNYLENKSGESVHIVSVQKCSVHLHKWIIGIKSHRYLHFSAKSLEGGVKASSLHYAQISNSR